MIEPLVVASCPHTALTVAKQCHHCDVGQCRLQNAAVRVLNIDSVAVSRHPQTAFRVVGHGQNVATRAGVQLHDAVSLAGIRNTRLQMTYPDSTVAVDGQTGHVVAR